MAYYENVAAKKSSDPDSKLLSPTAPQKASNQAQFTSPVGKTLTTKDVGNQQQSAPTSKGTGSENVPTAIALAGKRKLAIKVPANF